MSKTIQLTQGQEAIVSDEDYEWLNGYKWCFARVYPYYGYAVRSQDGTTLYMHREIIRPPDGLLADHINRNTLDNRRSNLRIVDAKGNSSNRSKRRPTCPERQERYALERQAKRELRISKRQEKQELRISRRQEKQERQQATRRNVGLQIRRKRRSLALNQTELSLRVGVSRQSINYYENGKALPSEEVQKALCKALQIEQLP